MKNFKEIYKAPFTDTWGTVFTENNVYAFSFNENVNDEVRVMVIEALNGQKKFTVDTESQQEDVDALYYNESYIFSEEKEEVISIRGFGHLTGINGLNLSDEEASKIQDEFGEYVLSVIKGEIEPEECLPKERGVTIIGGGSQGKEIAEVLLKEENKALYTISPKSPYTQDDGVYQITSPKIDDSDYWMSIHNKTGQENRRARRKRERNNKP
jgi:hypothetical protein